MFSVKIHWQKVANSEQELSEKIPLKKFYKLSVRGKSIIIGKGSKGFFALLDKCPHQGKPLSHGYCENDKVVCMYHQMQFDCYTGYGSGGAVDDFKIETREDGLYVGVSYFSVF